VYGGDIVGFNFAAKKYIQKKTGVDDNAEYVFETISTISTNSPFSIRL
jgi:hypothetical protein